MSGDNRKAIASTTAFVITMASLGIAIFTGGLLMEQMGAMIGAGDGWPMWTVVIVPAPALAAGVCIYSAGALAAVRISEYIGRPGE